MRVNDAVIGMVLLVVGLGIFNEARGFPPVPGQEYGSAFFPMIIGLVLTTGGALLFIKGVRERRTVRWFTAPEWMSSPRSVANFLLVIAALIFYILASDTLGFALTSALLLVVLQLWLRVRLVPAIMVAAITTLIVVVAFGTLLRVPLPRGVIESFF